MFSRPEGICPPAREESSAVPKSDESVRKWLWCSGCWMTSVGVLKSIRNVEVAYATSVFGPPLTASVLSTASDCSSKR